MSPVAAAKPVRSAAPLPRFAGWWISRSMRPASRSRSSSRVPSVEQSSTTMISLSPPGALRTAAMRSSMVDFSL